MKSLLETFALEYIKYFNFLDPLNIGVVAGVLSLRARQTSAKPPFRSTSGSTKKSKTGQRTNRIDIQSQIQILSKSDMYTPEYKCEYIEIGDMLVNCMITQI